MTTPAEVEALIRRFGLEPHPEGGHYRRVFEHPDAVDGRPLASSILYLLTVGERSHWHRINAVEIWHFHAGEPLDLSISVDGRSVESFVLGSQLHDGHQIPQAVVPAGAWQSARPRGAFSMVGCTVVPAFTFDTFELAPAGWHPSATG